MLKIGDKVLINGVVEEIKQDVIVIKNRGGLFETVKEEILLAKEEKPKTLNQIRKEYGLPEIKQK